MNKFFVHLFVAAICFAFSVSVTNLSKLFRSENSSIDVIAVQPMKDLVFSEDEYQLREIYREYGPAQMRHDRGFFERIETDDFRLFFNNRSISREEDILWMESTPRDIIYNNEPLEIKIFGNSAMARTYFELRYPDGHIQAWETIDVWTKRGNRWQIRSTTADY